MTWVNPQLLERRQRATDAALAQARQAAGRHSPEPEAEPRQADLEAEP